MKAADVPEITDAQMAFGGYPEEFFKKVLDMEAKPNDAKWVSAASSIFFSGGSVVPNAKNGDAANVRIMRMLRAVLGSFKPKHEDKELVAGRLLRLLEVGDED